MAVGRAVGVGGGEAHDAANLPRHSCSAVSHMAHVCLHTKAHTRTHTHKHTVINVQINTLSNTLQTQPFLPFLTESK